MTVLSGPNKLLRNSFISTFKRDKLGSATEDDLRIIRTSGDQIQAEDSVADSLRYIGICARKDFMVIKNLSGFLPEEGTLRVSSVWTHTAESLRSTRSVATNSTNFFLTLFGCFTKQARGSRGLPVWWDHEDNGHLLGFCILHQGRGQQ
ncbi:unnamed protein product [Tuber aestivum]|uniref:Uncharacterized protein n=1 Tax=Tuber aestivum TaxID=59557 RepID=A0A292PXT2_9PEZI|nr:unnamed protein product [Tuber aestivum]